MTGFINKLITVNGKKIRISCPDNERPTTMAVVLSHGRFQPLQQFFSGTENIWIPPGVTVTHYTRHGECISSSDAYNIFYKLCKGMPVNSVKDYSARQTFKNYTIRPTPDALTYIPNTFCDVIYPVDIMHTEDIFKGIIANELPYTDIHFIACRKLQLTASGPI